MTDYLGDIRTFIEDLNRCVENAFEKHNKMMDDLLKSQKELTKYTKVMIIFTCILVAFTMIQIIIHILD